MANFTRAEFPIVGLTERGRQAFDRAKKMWEHRGAIVDLAPHLKAANLALDD